MSREDFVAIASRLFALFLVITTIRLVAAMFQSVASFPSTGAFVVYLVVIAVPALAAAALLWVFPLSLARRLLPVMRQPQPAVSAGSTTALELALTVLGFWVLATALADAVYWVAVVTYVLNSPNGPEFDLSQKAEFAATAAQLLMGGWLVFGHRGLASIVARLRYAGSSTDSAA